MRGRTKRNGLVVTHRGFEAEDSMLCPVQRACRAFLEAHAAVVVLEQWWLESDRKPSSLNMAELAAARDHRESALHIVRSLPARSKSAMGAKIEVHSVMSAWYNPQEGVVAEFAAEIIREAAPFFLAHSAQKAKPIMNGSAVGEGRHQWLDRLPRLLWFAHEQKEEVRRSQT